MIQNGGGCPLAFRRQQMKMNQPKGVGRIMKDCVGKYDFSTKSNSDPDRDIVYDMSGKGHNMQLINMQWREDPNYSWVKSGFYNGGLYFLPSNATQNEYGVIVGEPLVDFTIIVRRTYYNYDNNFFRAWTTLVGSGRELNSSYIMMEYLAEGNVFTSYVSGKGTYSGKTTDEVVWLTPSHYCGKKISGGTASVRPHDGYLYLNRLRGDSPGGCIGKIYCMYVFNRTLTPEELEQIIHEEISPNYIMPNIE